MRLQDLGMIGSPAGRPYLRLPSEFATSHNPLVLVICISNFEFVSDFDIRISDFPQLHRRTCAGDG